MVKTFKLVNSFRRNEIRYKPQRARNSQRMQQNYMTSQNQTSCFRESKTDFIAQFKAFNDNRQ